MSGTELKSHEGALSVSYSEPVSEERIRLFCQAVGAEPSRFAPPTFLTVFRAGEFALFEQIGLKISSVLHGEQHYEYESGIEAGDQVDFRTTLVSVVEKKGASGKMSILTLETRVRISSPRPRSAGLSGTTIIVREKAPS